jgi:putative phosphoribosyl transferase
MKSECETLSRRSIDIIHGYNRLTGDLTLPEALCGLVVFAHGSGSSRLSPRNQFVAARLNQQSIGTLLFDLLTLEEDRIYSNRFNITLLTERLEHVVRWVLSQRELSYLPLGLFGASTGAAAALRTAAVLKEVVKAVVSRGGRPDLTGDESLSIVSAPTLLIVGGEDSDVLELNRGVFSKMNCERELYVVPGAGHLFEEPGRLEAVSDLAADWFARHFLQPTAGVTAAAPT